jgi:hypothetical protein
MNANLLICDPSTPPREEHSEREKAKKLPSRLIHRAAWVDKSKYTGEKLREIRAQRGVGSRRMRAKYSSGYTVDPIL